MRWLLPCLAVVLGTLLGCGSFRSTHSESHFSPKLTAPSQFNAAIAESLASKFASAPATPAKPIHVLAVSGGGQYAAFNAGQLVGWTESGTRPEFDIVTGVSSGAVIAAYAFLGPKYDAAMAEFFTRTNNSDLFVYRPLRNIRRNESLASPDKLAAMVEARITEEILCELRAAHTAGRRLYVATMNVRTRRACIWDVGAIACSDRPDSGELVRKVILAAVTLPGVLPPVKFDVEVGGCRYVEEHVDGGAATQIFLRPGPSSVKDQPSGWLKGSHFYAMAAGKIYPPELTGTLGFVKRVSSILSASLYALYRSELLNLYAFCQVSGMAFHSTAIPQDAEVPPNSTTFNSADGQMLFALGYRLTKPSIVWRTTAPGTEPGEEEAPIGAEGLLPACRK
jgi:hypothetical protein